MELHHKLRRDPTWDPRGCNLCGQLGHQAAMCPNGTVNWKEIYGEDAFVLKPPVYESALIARRKAKEIDFAAIEARAREYAAKRQEAIARGEDPDALAAPGPGLAGAAGGPAAGAPQLPPGWAIAHDANGKVRARRPRSPPASLSLQQAHTAGLSLHLRPSLLPRRCALLTTLPPCLSLPPSLPPSPSAPPLVLSRAGLLLEPRDAPDDVVAGRGRAPRGGGGGGASARSGGAAGGRRRGGGGGDDGRGASGGGWRSSSGGSAGSGKRRRRAASSSSKRICTILTHVLCENLQLLERGFRHFFHGGRSRFG